MRMYEDILKIIRVGRGIPNIYWCLSSDTPIQNSDLNNVCVNCQGNEFYTILFTVPAQRNPTTSIAGTILIGLQKLC